MQESKKQNAPELWNFFGNDSGQIFYDTPKDVTLSIFSNVPPLSAFLHSATDAKVNVKSTSTDKRPVSSTTPSIIVDHKKPIISAML